MTIARRVLAAALIAAASLAARVLMPAALEDPGE